MSDRLSDSEKARVLRGLANWIRAGLRAGTPKYKIVLALRERGLKLETARALVDANGDVSRKARGRFVSQKELIRRIEALIKVTFEK